MSFSLRWENTITTLKWRLYVISLPRSLVFRGPILHTLHVLFNWLAPRIPYGILLEYSSIHVPITIDSIFHDYINQDKSPNCRWWYATLNPHEPSIFYSCMIHYSMMSWCPLLWTFMCGISEYCNMTTEPNIICWLKLLLYHTYIYLCDIFTIVIYYNTCIYIYTI